jgi:hypothetical protein
MAGYNGDMTNPGEFLEPLASLPWEERGRIGAWRGYFETLWPSLLQPQRFFAVLDDPGKPESLSDSLRFDLVTHLIGSTGGAVFYGITLWISPPDALAQLSATWRLGLVIGLFLASGPAGVLFDLCYALLVHGALRFLGETPTGLRGTTRAVMYGGGATALNATLLLPALFIPQLWGTYCTIVALTRAQKVSRGQALTAVIVPSGVLIMLGLIVIALGMSMAMDKLSGMGLLPAGIPT